MGVGGLSGTDRLRTIWTPEMDRYFIDLMLEQVRKGSRIDDHLFTKRAWKNMASLFNAKFRFQYEKDVLKNRHKTLRNLYKAIKSLLHHKGFSWDETRQMVTADNQVWDEYIKLHPDARSYRIKTIPHYNDLCEIYKNAMTDGEGTTTTSVAQSISVDEAAVDALQDIMIDEDYTVSLPELSVDDIPQTSSDTGARSGTRSRTYWQPPMDRYFIDLMLDHVQQGNQIDGLFHKQAWVEMLASFNAKFGFHYDVDILKNRYKTLRRQYNVIKNLLELDGFIWDETRQMVTADDCVWQDYIKANTNARQYMTRPVPYYKDLCKICGEINADGGKILSGNEFCQQDEGLDVNIYQNLLSLIPSFSSEELVGEEESSCVANQTNRRRLENPSNPSHSKKTKTKDEGVASALREMATAVSSLADKRKDDEDSIPIETVIEAIQTLPDMDEELVLDACDFLEDEKKAKTFLALDVKLRKKWLVRKLRPQEQ